MENNFNNDFLKAYQDCVTKGIIPKYLILDKETYETELKTYCNNIMNNEGIEIETYNGLIVCITVSKKKTFIIK